jgi:hypothetical protein
MYRAAAHDEKVHAGFESVGSRRKSPAAMLDPRLLARILRPEMAGR